MSALTDVEINDIKTVVAAIVEAAAPVILKAVAASQPGVKMCGELMVTEPLRDYEKELWIGIMCARAGTDNSIEIDADIADTAVATFKERFNK